MRRFFLFCLVSFFWCFSAYSFWLDTLAKRFQPIEAKVIAVEGRRIFIDAGRSKGVKKFDLFSIYKPLKVIKSSSGKSIVLWSSPVAVARVVSVEDDYSVVVVSGKVKIKEGWKAVRFKDVRACFSAEGEEASKVKKMIYTTLSFIDWSPEGCHLRFKYTRSGYIDVLDDKGVEIAFIPVLRVDLPRPEPVRKSGKRYTKGGSTIYMENYRDVAALPVYVLSADFGTVEGEGGLKVPAIVYTDGGSIFFALVVDYEPKVVSRYDYKGYGTIIHVAAGDPDGDGNLEVVATAYDMDNGPVSFILRINQKGQFSLVRDRIYYLLNMEDTDLDGTKDTILATGYDEDDLFEKKLYIMKLENDKLKVIDKLSVPDVFKLYGCYYGDIDGDGNREVLFTTDTYKLAIYDGTDMWLSAESVGGGYNYVRITKGTASFSYEEGISIDPDPVVFKNDKKVEVLVVKNISRHKHIVGNLPLYKGAEILQLVQEFYGYSLVTVSEEIDGVVQSMGVVGKELWCIMNVEAPFRRNAKSYIIAFPLVMD